LSLNISITPEFVERHLDKDWWWGSDGLSTNPHHFRVIERHIEKPWHWGRYGLSANPSITPEFVERHIEKPWCWGSNGLSSNPFTRAQELRDRRLPHDFKQELFRKTWCSKRVIDWCMDIEEKLDIEF
jgi:hypothetical protein